MIAGLPALSHEQQQEAVERIQELMAQGMSSGEAITLVAAEIRANHTGEMVAVRFEDDDVGDAESDDENANDDGEERYVDRYEENDDE
ncbi:MAG TPA: YoaH family protein [Buttiauxella sp.]|uniref:YoaH family protein n=1 Tax=Buttiauxella sp. TaxID=1972222 RepID=UPI002B45E541|nr:YoaH family protein [Buttiauxella sp.]HKM96095.1 YoaH family protein [Buttiauxella sp.]